MDRNDILINIGLQEDNCTILLYPLKALYSIEIHLEVVNFACYLMKYLLSLAHLLFGIQVNSPVNIMMLTVTDHERA